MMLDNLGTYALEQINKYTEMFRAFSTAQVEAALVREKGSRARTSQRSYYLAALRQECEQRGNINDVMSAVVNQKMLAKRVKQLEAENHQLRTILHDSSLKTTK